MLCRCWTAAVVGGGHRWRYVPARCTGTMQGTGTIWNRVRLTYRTSIRVPVVPTDLTGTTEQWHYSTRTIWTPPLMCKYSLDCFAPHRYTTHSMAYSGRGPPSTAVGCIRRRYPHYSGTLNYPDIVRCRVEMADTTVRYRPTSSVFVWDCCSVSPPS